MAAAQAPEFTFTDEKGVTHVHSYGMIVFRPEGSAVDAWKVLLIQHNGGHWGFPKGRPEAGDADALAAATREVLEETGVRVVRTLPTPVTERYSFQRKAGRMEKTVTLFLGEAAADAVVRLQASEVRDHRWCTLAEAEALCGRPESSSATIRDAQAVLQMEEDKLCL